VTTHIASTLAGHIVFYEGPDFGLAKRAAEAGAADRGEQTKVMTEVNGVKQMSWLSPRPRRA
jgi:hypothetical protein